MISALNMWHLTLPVLESMPYPSRARYLHFLSIHTPLGQPWEMNEPGPEQTQPVHLSSLSLFVLINVCSKVLSALTYHKPGTQIKPPGNPKGAGRWGTGSQPPAALSSLLGLKRCPTMPVGTPLRSSCGRSPTFLIPAPAPRKGSKCRADLTSRRPSMHVMTHTNRNSTCTSTSRQLPGHSLQPRDQLGARGIILAMIQRVLWSEPEQTAPRANLGNSQWLQHL